MRNPPITNPLLMGWRLGLALLLVLGFARVQAQDVQVVNIQTLGKLSVLYSLPHTVMAAIRNNGPGALDSRLVTLSVTGANAFTSTTTTGYMAPGATKLVTFDPYPSKLNQGTNTLTVSVPDDTNNNNNAVTFTQQVTSSRITQVDETQGFTGGISGTIGADRATFDNEVAAKFTLTQPSAILNEVKLTFINAGVPDSRYGIEVYDASGTGGTPGKVLYRSNSLARPTIVGAGQTATVAVPVPALAVPSQFYVAVHASPTSTANYSTLELATQVEDHVRPATNYSRFTYGEPWIDLRTTDAQVRLAIEASVVVAPSTCNPPTNVAVTNIQANSATVTFTPASTSTSYTLIYDNYGFSPNTGGQVVTTTGTSITLQGLQPATRYQVYVHSTCGPGTLSALSEQVTFQTAPICPVPQAVAVSNIAATQATFAFTGPTTGTGYTYWLLPKGAPAPTTGGNAATGSPFTLTGLTPGTNYDFYLRTNCGATNQSSLVGPVTFTTLCTSPALVITSFPYLENFDNTSAGTLPCGVTVLDANQDGRTWVVASDNDGSPPNAIRYRSLPGKDADDWFFTQPLRLRAGYRYQLQFRYRGCSQYSREVLEVRYGTAPTPASQTTQLYVSTNILTSVYLTSSTDEVKAITPATTGTYYLAFRSFTAPGVYPLGVYGCGVDVDDVRLTETAIAGNASAAPAQQLKPALASTKSAALDQQIDLYPNPGKGIFSLDVRRVADQASALQVTVSSVMGQTLYTTKVKKGAIYPLDLSELATGLYLVKVQQGADFTVRKLLIE